MNASSPDCPHCCLHEPATTAQPPRLLVTATEAKLQTPDPTLSWWRTVIAFLRRWSGDDAYERYLAEHRQHSHALLNRREFYRRYLDHRAGGSRCC